MKNTFAVTMTLLLALALGGSFAGYRIATTPHEEAKAGAEGIGDPTTQSVPSEEVPSAREAATQGSNDLSTAQGNVMEQDQAGGAKAGENGAVAAEGGQDAGGASTDAGTTSNQDGGTRTDGGTTSEGAGGAGDDSAGTGTREPSSGGESGASPGAEGSDTGTGTGDAADGSSGEDPNDGDARTTASPTAEGSEGTQLGQTGASNTEKAVASSPGVSDAKAAEIASANSGDTAAGQQQYVASCGGCHGATGGGGVGPALNGAKGPGSWDVAQFTAAVRQGHAPDRDLGPVMPRFTQEQLSDEQVSDIYAYLKTLRQ